MESPSDRSSSFLDEAESLFAEDPEPVSEELAPPVMLPLSEGVSVFLICASFGSTASSLAASVFLRTMASSSLVCDALQVVETFYAYYTALRRFVQSSARSRGGTSPSSSRTTREGGQKHAA